MPPKKPKQHTQKKNAYFKILQDLKSAPITKNELAALKTNAEKGDIQAQVVLGGAYCIGDGVERNFHEAKKWFDLVLSNNYARMGMWERGQWGIAKANQKTKTVKFYQKIVLPAYRLILDELACAKKNVSPVFSQIETKSEIKEITLKSIWGMSLDDLKKVAEAQNVDAQAWLGYLYLEGQVADAASLWLRRAAKHSDKPGGWWAKGLCYQQGIFGKVDIDEALKCYRRAYEANYASAHTTLGSCYAEGIGVGTDYTEAVKLYRLAAEQEEPEAYRRLAICYRHGIVVEKDIKKSTVFFQAAAIIGYGYAQICLGLIFAHGNDVIAQDQDKAQKWLARASLQGYQVHRQNSSEPNSSFIISLKP